MLKVSRALAGLEGMGDEVVCSGAPTLGAGAIWVPGPAEAGREGCAIIGTTKP